MDIASHETSTGWSEEQDCSRAMGVRELLLYGKGGCSRKKGRDHPPHRAWAIRELFGI